MKHLVIGNGEIGRAIASIFECEGINAYEQPIDRVYDVLHICIPFGDKFIDIVKEYQSRFLPKYTVIHSTVKPGTSRALDAIHSPCIGFHPYLEPGIRTFTKFLSGEKASGVANEFRKYGLTVYLFDKSETSELMKILDTTFYGLCIEYTKDVKKQCELLGVPFEAWTIYIDNYNKGYDKLGHPEFIRPNLIPIMKPQGGHCTVPNCDLIDTEFTRLVKKLNSENYYNIKLDEK